MNSYINISACKFIFLQQNLPIAVYPRNNAAYYHIFFSQPETGVWGDGNRAREPQQHHQQQNSFYNHVQQQRELGSQQQYFDNEELTEEDNNGFVKPRSNEKKDKKVKRSEEKKRAREREAKKALAAASEYIPGMEGSVRPNQDQPLQHDFEVRLHQDDFCDIITDSSCCEIIVFS